MKITTEPRSDQLNADDFINGPGVFTVEKVTVGTAEQKYDIHLVEVEGRVWRPPLTVLRLLKAAWGDDGAAWATRMVKLYRDPSITFGRDKVGGIRVSHVSHIDEPVTDKFQSTRGKRAEYTLQPMERIDILRAEWHTADDDRKAEIKAEVDKLSGGQA